MNRFDGIEFGSNLSLEQESQPTQPPDDGPSFCKTARHMRRSGHMAESAKLYRQSIGFDEHFYAAWVELVDTLIRDEQFDEALKTASEAVSNYGQVRILYASKALAMAHKGRIVNALPMLQVSQEGQTLSWYCHIVDAEISLLQSKDNRLIIIPKIEKAIQSCQNPWEPCLLAGCMFRAKEMHAFAAGFFAEAAHYDPRSPISWMYLADAFRNLRLYDQALFYYRRVIELDPTNRMAIMHQKQCTPRLFGLMNIFNRQSLNKRWKQEMDKFTKPQEPVTYDF